MITTQTIPELLVATRGNQAEVARQLDVNRSTVMKYARDNNATGHIIVNGCLMVKTAKKAKESGMKDYSAMDDGAINMLVGESLGLTSYYLNHDCSVQFRNEKGHIKGTKNYCNNPADGWQIITANHIGIMPFKSGAATAWPTSIGLLSNFHVKHENPLRAAMICYLMMKDSEKCDG